MCSVLGLFDQSGQFRVLHGFLSRLRFPVMPTCLPQFLADLIADGPQLFDISGLAHEQMIHSPSFSCYLVFKAHYVGGL